MHASRPSERPHIGMTGLAQQRLFGPPPARRGLPAHLTVGTFETERRGRNRQMGAQERQAPGSVNGSVNEEESEHAKNDSHDSRYARLSRR